MDGYRDESFEQTLYHRNRILTKVLRWLSGSSPLRLSLSLRRWQRLIYKTDTTNQNEKDAANIIEAALKMRSLKP